MSRARSGDAPARVAWAVAQLELAPAAQVLEVGCGAGHALALVAARLTRGVVVGIDRSALQVRGARQRNAAAIAAGRARVEALSLERAPEGLGEQRFDAVLAINVNAFWTQPEATIDAARRLLRRRGRLTLCYEPPSAAQLARLEASLPALLEAHDLRIHAVRTERLARSSLWCIIASPS